jgi:predicted transglutaminase-like cysteine proteinase
MESHNAGPIPVRQEQMLASLPPPDAQQPPSAEPFGQIAIPIASGDSLNRWRFVENEIDAEAAVVDRCLRQQECSAAARKFLDIVAQGRARNGLARVGVINRAVNLAIVPESDVDQWGVPDRWSPPLETLTTGHGDCEDYAIAKYVALLSASMSEEDVKLVIVHRRLPDEEHAVTAVRVDGQWFILDNRTQALVPDLDVRVQRRWSFWIPVELK